MVAAVKRFWNDESGATAGEYALMVALVAVAIIAAVTLMSDALQTKFEEVGTEIDNAGT
jgi:pilus assembly protein Flp/PilA